jgi:hypothetical protein
MWELLPLLKFLLSILLGVAGIKAVIRAWNSWRKSREIAKHRKELDQSLDSMDRNRVLDVFNRVSISSSRRSDGSH